MLIAKGYASRYFFSALSLQRSSLVPVELTSVYRQKNPFFVDLLNRIRIGDDLDYVTTEVNRRCLQEGFRPDITLTCTNNTADEINRGELCRLPDREYCFKGTIEGRFSLEHDKLPSPINLKLKAGARVMFTKNDEQHRWVNGTLGIVRVIGQTTIRVELISDSCGTVCEVLPVTWETYKYSYDAGKDQIVARKEGVYTQFPLMLAWAVTIHKSQGKTLENVLVDLGTGAFDFGQVYVALSRCRSIEGVRLKRPLRTTDVKCDPRIKRLYLDLAERKQNAAIEQLGPVDG
jgi:hypothetical protein